MSKQTNKLIDTQDTCNYLEKVYKHLRNVSKKFQTEISSRRGEIPILAKFLVKSKPPNRLTDNQEICSYLEIVYKDLRNVSKKIQKDISSKNGDFPIFV